MQEVSGSIPLFSTKKALYFVGSTVLFFFYSSKKIRGCTARHTGEPVTPPISTTADISPAGSTGVSVGSMGQGRQRPHQRGRLWQEREQ